HIWDDWCNTYALSRYSFSNLNDQEFTDETAQSDYNALDNALSDIRPSVRMLKRHKALEEEIKNYFEAVEGTGELALVKPADDNLKELLRKFGQYVMSDLGPVYGWQWRHSGAEYQMDGLKPAHMIDYSGQGVDQLEKIVNGLKRSPESRRLVVSAWNPKDLAYMALEPCHDSFQVSVRDGKLDLTWRQRSVDCALGLPFNIASYATLLHLLAMETGYEEGDLTGHLGNTHIYNNHIDGVKEQLTRKPGKLPTIHTENFDTIYDWHYTDSRIEGYDPQPKIQFPLAV
ncbi:MAG: thymidylate synthase, partial [Nanoarchaeota archaeon]